MRLDGKSAELMAAAHLQRNGLTLLESNYRCRFGEIDLIMRDAEEIVFVEVRLRSSASFGGAGASITTAKQQKIARTAEHYLLLHGTAACRFDAVLLDALAEDRIHWLKNAFEATWT